MRRAAASLLALAACVVAGPAPDEPALNESDIYLVGGETPVEVVYELERPSGEVHLLFEFRFGLYAISPEGVRETARAGVRLEFAAPGEEFVPAAFQPDGNADWIGDPAGEPGLWFTGADALHTVERRIVLRFPAVDRYRVRIAGLFKDTASMRRVPHLVGIAEAPAEDPPVDVEDLPVDVEDLPVEVVERPIVVFEEPPCPCPFCGATLYLSARVGRAGYWNCRRCTGAVHVDGSGRCRASVRRGGRRSTYDLVGGRARGFIRHPRHAADRPEPRRRADSAPTRRRVDPAPTRRRVDPAPTRRRIDSTPTRRRIDPAPTRRRVDRAPTRRRIDSAPTRRRVDPAPTRRRVDPAPRRRVDPAGTARRAPPPRAAPAPRANRPARRAAGTGRERLRRRNIARAKAVADALRGKFRRARDTAK